MGNLVIVQVTEQLQFTIAFALPQKLGFLASIQLAFCHQNCVLQTHVSHCPNIMRKAELTFGEKNSRLEVANAQPNRR